VAPHHICGCWETLLTVHESVKSEQEKLIWERYAFYCQVQRQCSRMKSLTRSHSSPCSALEIGQHTSLSLFLWIAVGHTYIICLECIV
jgi:hypothetical protein